MKFSFDPEQPFLDVTAPEHGVQVRMAKDGKVLWVDVDGVCVLRICRVPDVGFNLPIVQEILDEAARD